MKRRFRAFGIPSHQLNTSDVIGIRAIASELISTVRDKQSPLALILNTYRFGPHSKGDDTRDPKLLDQLKQAYDPIKILGSLLNQVDKAIIESEVIEEINAAFNSALNDPFPVDSL